MNASRRHPRLKRLSTRKSRRFTAKLKSMDVGPVVMQVQGRIEEICKTELQRYVNKIGPQEPKQVQELEHMISRIAAKIAHPLVVQLRNGQESPSESAYADLIKRFLK